MKYIEVRLIVEGETLVGYKKGYPSEVVDKLADHLRSLKSAEVEPTGLTEHFARAVDRLVFHIWRRIHG